jgi:glycine cleavage system H protein
MSIPNDLKYSKTDEWVKVDGNVATIGITDYAQDQLSDVVFVEVNAGVGENVKKGTVFATIESVKAAADVNLPVSGKVTEVNEALPEKPELVNQDPYGQAWLLKVQLSDPLDTDGLMDADAYQKYLEERSH